MRFMTKAALLLTSVLTATNIHAQSQPSGAATTTKSLERSFRSPPITARPIVWWHWMNGNITADGIHKDLEWMRRIGLGGVQAFDAALATPQVVEKRVIYMTPAWKEIFSAAVDQAHGYDFDFGIAASPGWSETGGPWVKPADAMKKLVWSTIDVVGGRPVHTKLPAPPHATGPFQDLKLGASIFDTDTSRSATAPTYYADVAVLAHPVDAGAKPVPIVTAGGKAVEGAALWDGKFETSIEVDPPKPDTPLLVYTYATPRTIRSATFFEPVGLAAMLKPSETWLQYGNQGRWIDIGKLPIKKVPTTISFAPVTARAFRIVTRPLTAKMPSWMTPAAGLEIPPLFGLVSGPVPNASTKVTIGEFSLSSAARIDRFEAKAGFSTAEDYYALSAGVPDTAGVDPRKVIDLTGRMKPDGTLDWTPPPGEWRIIRFGASLLGTTNHPATPEATGLEVDKYDSAAVRRYFSTYIDKYRDFLGNDMIGPGGLESVTTDSIESGDANWTPRMIEQFKRLRGYDPTPYLPALTGTIVGSRAQSDKFLYDYRRTLADLIASEHYGTIAAVAHENHLKVFGESLEGGRPQLGDGMAMRSHADVPMAALWTYRKGGSPNPTSLGDIRGAASVANIYGRKWVAAESMTSMLSPYAYAPSDLKPVIDLEFVTGVNRPVIHSSVHQPLDKAPGLTLGPTGQTFNRLESWAEMAKPWIDYIARSSFMLQQGHSVADIAYFYGEEAPLTQLWLSGKMEDVPAHNAFDYVNSDALLHELSEQDGAIVTKGGARYKLLYLSGTSERMTVPVLRKIADLAEAGAIIVGNPPTSSPSLSDDPAEFARLVKRLWSGAPVTRVGRGRVVAGKDLEAGLAIAGVSPDFTYTGGSSDADIRFLHRHIADGDIYFVNNRKSHAETVNASFRVTGKAAELCRAETGTCEPASYTIAGDHTVVPLELASNDAVFVVFRKPAQSASISVPVTTYTPVATLTEPWSVSFQPGRGAPASATFPTLEPLNMNTNPGIKYFSGIATYHSTFEAPAGYRPGTPMALDLGKVGVLADVTVNGKFVGSAWHAPFRVDIGSAIRPGTNTIAVRVANLWVNRLIGDKQPGATAIGYTSGPSYRADAPLRPSGLIGPVQLLVGQQKQNAF